MQDSSASLNEIMAQSAVLSCCKNDTGKEKRYTNMDCVMSFQTTDPSERLMWSKPIAPVGTVLCCQLAAWAKGVVWQK